MRILKKFAIVALSFVGLCLLASPLRAQYQTITITDCSTDAALRAATLRAATSAPADIRFDCGSATIALQAPLFITETVVMDGGGIITLTGSGITHHFVITDYPGSLELRNIRLVDGYAPAATTGQLPSAGSIRTTGNLVLDNVTFQGNRALGADSAGAIYNKGSLRVSNSRFLENVGAGSGVITNHWSAEVDHTFFSGNRGDIAGAYLDRGTTRLFMSHFEANQSAEGSGAYLRQGPIAAIDNNWSYLYQNTFAENAGGSCAAVQSDEVMFTLQTSTISTNTASAGGALCIFAHVVYGLDLELLTVSANRTTQAAVYISSTASVSLHNATVVHNVNTSGGAGGIYATRNSLVTVNNAIIAHNGAQNCDMRNPQRQPVLYSVVGDASCKMDTVWWEESESVIADPLLGPLANNGGPTLTHLPEPASPAAGLPLDRSCQWWDQRYVRRWYDTCDAGSVEVEQRDISQHLPLLSYRGIYPTPTPIIEN